MQRRGLKLRDTKNHEPDTGVASHAEAWIETNVSRHVLHDSLSPLMQRRGLKLDESAQLLALFGRLSCRGVD